MPIAIRLVNRLQDLHDVNITPGAGVDEYAVMWDQDTGKFVARNTIANATNADTVDGSHAAAFAPASHTHGGGDVTSAVADATNADTVDGSHASAFAPAASAHNPVTLDVNADTVLSLSTQALGLDTQTANRVLAGPTTGAAAVPAFRALVTGDLPAGINADTVDGSHAAAFAAASHTHGGDDITSTVASANQAVNAGYLMDGATPRQIGNAGNDIPLNSGTLMTNLNADKLDGYHAANTTGAVPISNSTLNTDLNADKLDGYHASASGAASSVVATDASGNLKAAGGLYVGGQSAARHLMNSIVNLADDASSSMFSGEGSAYGLYVIFCSTDGSVCLFIALSAVTIVSDPWSYYSASDTDGKHCLSVSAGQVYIKNRLGSTHSYRVHKLS